VQEHWVLIGSKGWPGKCSDIMAAQMSRCLCEGEDLLLLNKYVLAARLLIGCKEFFERGGVDSILTIENKNHIFFLILRKQRKFVAEKT
jgi:hypothetical protein